MLKDVWKIFCSLLKVSKSELKKKGGRVEKSTV